MGDVWGMQAYAVYMRLGHRDGEMARRNVDSRVSPVSMLNHACLLRRC